MRKQLGLALRLRLGFINRSMVRAWMSNNNYYSTSVVRVESAIVCKLLWSDYGQGNLTVQIRVWLN